MIEMKDPNTFATSLGKFLSCINPSWNDEEVISSARSFIEHMGKSIDLSGIVTDDQFYAEVVSAYSQEANG